MSASPRRVLEVLRQEGPRSVWMKVLGDTVYRRLVIAERTVGPAADAVAPEDVALSFLDRSDLDEYEALRPGTRATAEARLARGHRCAATRLRGELVSVRWLAASDAWIDYLRMTLPLRSREVYHYDSFTAPSRRGRGLSPLSQQLLFPALAAEGLERVVRAILPENAAAWRDADKAGFRRTGVVGYVGIGRVRKEFVRREPGA